MRTPAMRRVTPQHLELIAFNTGEVIEYDHVGGIAVLTVPGPPKRIYYAALERAS